jgi:hypothetical protein
MAQKAAPNCRESKKVSMAAGMIAVPVYSEVNRAAAPY